MSYMIEFSGELKFNKPLTNELKTFIKKFANTRRMQRDIDVIKEYFPDWKENCFLGDLGPDGDYFVGGGGFAGQQKDPSVMSYNESYPQPSLWCGWTVNDKGNLVWNGSNNFYKFEEWLNYLIKHFFSPLGYVLEGQLIYQGENIMDRGTVTVKNNEVVVKENEQ